MSQRPLLLLTTPRLLLSLAPVFLLLTARPVCPAASSDLDNTLLESPKISCEESRIKMSIRTAQPFAGNVYAKGFFHKDVCRVQGNGAGHVANISIPVNADCGMRRRRSASPHGLSLEIDVILMFHRKFLTKNDRAFHVECQYVEMDQRVGNRLDISALPSTELSQTLTNPQTMPKCRYEVLSGDTGHPISFAAIGQPIQHKWSCTGGGGGGGGASKEESGAGLYCLTVHSCEVDDGQGNVQKLLDEKGCSLDKGLFGSVDYKADLEAVQRGNAFKFADRPTIYFSCQLRLELKSGWKECKRSADACAGGRGGGASVSRSPEPDSEGGEEDEEFGGSTNGMASSSPDFPTPSPSFSSQSAAAGFSMSTGTTSRSPPESGNRQPPNGEEDQQPEEEGGEETKPQQQTKRPKGSKGGGGGGMEGQQRPKAGKGAGQSLQQTATTTMVVGGGGAEEEESGGGGAGGVYVERPTLAIIRKTKRTTRASSIRTTTVAFHPPTKTTPPPSSPKGGGFGGAGIGDIYAPASSSNCNPDQFGLNTDCTAFDSMSDSGADSLPFSVPEENADDDQKHSEAGDQRRISLRQRSTTPLEEMEQRMNRLRDRPSSSLSSSSSTVDIDVSQSVDVLDVVSQSDVAASTAAGSNNVEANGTGGLEKFCQQVNPRRIDVRAQAEPVEPFQQLCISRQLLSSALFLALLCLLSSLTVLICCLVSYQHRLRGRQRRLLPTSVDRTSAAANPVGRPESRNGKSRE